MKTKLTFLALALFLVVFANATTPATWTSVANGSASEKGEVAWGDFNNDGNLDLFQLSDNVYKLFMNNGNETFSDVTADKLPGTLPSGANESSVIFLDYNNDGNLDILLTGWPLSNATLYKNNGAPDYTFTIDTDNSLIQVRTGNGGNAHAILSAVDYNNDGWVDLFMEGWSDNAGTRVVTLYKNVTGVFQRQTTPVGGTEDFEGMNGGSLHTGDINNDGYVDVITSGYSVVGSYKTYLYVNQGDGTFVKSNASFPGIEQGESVLFDSNNDGWLDVFVAGVGHDGANWIWPGNLYLNNQDGTFTLQANTNLPSGTQGYTSFEIGDINNDGYTDLMIMLPSGENTAMYYNNGDNTFLKDVPQTEARARAGSMSLADFNNDNKLDYFLFGWRDGYTFPDNTNFGSNWTANFTKNTIAATNLAPTAPANIAVNKVNGKYVVTWDKSTDDITIQNALRYNVYVTKQGGSVYAYSPVDLTTGKLKTSSQTLLSKNEIVLDLGDVDFMVGVQAVDQANVGSTFTTATYSNGTTDLSSVEKMNVGVFAKSGTIEINNNMSSGISYSIVSLNGKNIENGLCDSGSRALSSKLNKGMYLVKISHNDSAITKKVVVL